MRLSRILHITLLMVMMSVLTSCRDELCYNHFRSASLSLSWEQEWERDYGMNHSATWDANLHGFDYNYLRPLTPEWVNLIRFSSDGSRHETYLNPEGGDVTLDAGEGQSFLLYNGDTEYIILSDIASPPNARASATERSRASLTYVSEIHPTARTTNPPDVIYASYISNIPSIEKHDYLPISVRMHPLVFTYLVRFEFDYGKEHIALARGALGGMAESVYLLDGRSSDESTIILFDCDLKDYGCQAQVRSFGIPGFPDEYYNRESPDVPNRPYTLNLEVRLNNGKYVEFNYDVSDQIANQPRGGIIKISGLRIEDEASFTDSGFNVDISDWGDREDIELPVGPNNEDPKEEINRKYEK